MSGPVIVGNFGLRDHRAAVASLPSSVELARCILHQAQAPAVATPVGVPATPTGIGAAGVGQGFAAQPPGRDASSSAPASSIPA